MPNIISNDFDVTDFFLQKTVVWIDFTKCNLPEKEVISSNSESEEQKWELRVRRWIITKVARAVKVESSKAIAQSLRVFFLNCKS